tara:strand:- start:133 stop:375 length:243 start_codon:yes stop_codon:yes gene_type:complete
MAELSDGGVCNAFVGATPGHKVLAGQLDRMTVYYQGVYKLHASYQGVKGVGSLPLKGVYMHTERRLNAPTAEPPLSQAEA